MRASVAAILLRSKQSGLHQPLMKAALLYVLTFAFLLLPFAFAVFFAGATCSPARSVTMQRPLILPPLAPSPPARSSRTSTAASSYVRPAASRPRSLSTAQSLSLSVLIRELFRPYVCR